MKKQSELPLLKQVQKKGSITQLLNIGKPCWGSYKSVYLTSVKRLLNTQTKTLSRFGLVGIHFSANTLWKQTRNLGFVYFNQYGLSRPLKSVFWNSVIKTYDVLASPTIPQREYPFQFKVVRYARRFGHMALKLRLERFLFSQTAGLGYL